MMKPTMYRITRILSQQYGNEYINAQYLFKHVSGQTGVEK